MIETQKVALVTDDERSEKNRPTIIQWKDERVMRPHPITTGIMEIVRKSKNRDVIKIGMVGEPHTGKSTQLDTCGHLTHKLAKKILGIDFAVRTYTRDDFVDIEETLENLPTANFILKFNDLSFLKASHGSKKIEKVEQNMTEIRHLKGRKGWKYIIFYDYHYNKALPPYLRQSDFKIFTGIGSSELKNMVEMMGPQHLNKIMFFKKMSDAAPSTEKFTFKLGNKGFFSYAYKNPFIPLLFWNEQRPRILVSPTREWFDPICATCSASDANFKTEVDIDALIEQGGKNFTPRCLEAAVKLKLHSIGVNVYGKNVTNAGKWLDKIMEKRRVRLEDIAAKYNFTPTVTKLRKSIDEVINTSPKAD